jgi:type I restriction enzyme R subunit
VLELYKKNALTLTRQVPCHPNDGCTVDMLFAVNGVPVATCELKNPNGTELAACGEAIQRRSRSARTALSIQITRSCPFRGDPDEVHMTTRLPRERISSIQSRQSSHECNAAR